MEKKLKGIEKLEQIVRSGEVSKLAARTRPFGGADIAVVEKARVSKDGFYPDPLYVETQYVKEVSWLIFQLKHLFDDSIDFANKYYFYGHLAERAIASIAEHGDVLETTLLNMLDEVKKMADISCPERTDKGMGEK